MVLKLRVRDRLIVAAALVSVMARTPAALAQPPKLVAKFSAVTAGLTPGSGVATTIDVLRWSTDEEANKLVGAFKDKGDKAWADALGATPSVGYVWTATSSLGYSVKLAREVAMPDGSSRILLAIERPLGSWDRPAWKAAGPAATDFAFSVIELRVSKAGIGEGKASLAAKLMIDDAAKSVALDNYAAAPVLLRNVRKPGAVAAAPAAPTARPAAPVQPAPVPAAPKRQF